MRKAARRCSTGSLLDRCDVGRDTVGMDMIQVITDIVPRHLPQTQAVYLFGSAQDVLTTGEVSRHEARDIDLAVLLPPAIAQAIGNLFLSDLRWELEHQFQRDVDLINLRIVSTVFQNEIVATGQSIFVQDRNALEEFEMLTLSFYQKLNDEREKILEDVFSTGRAYKV